MRWSCFIYWGFAVVSIIACVGQGMSKRGAPINQAAKSIKAYKVPSALFVDSDGDGVASYMDECPNTPKGIKVNDKGCCLSDQAQKATQLRMDNWLYKDIVFGSNQTAFDEKYLNVLTAIGLELRNRPELQIEIQGHSDSRGSRAYNFKISEKRAKSVSLYLQACGIDKSRIRCISCGPDRPIASNNTAAGRARNRRVETLPIN
jgi:OmpA-OmpF porin, OOP family